MGQHYIDIQLRPEPELAAHHLLSALYARLHLALVELRADAIGVSFPGFDASRPSLGNCMRLLGTAPSLAALMALPWLRGVRDHVAISDARPVPPHAPHRTLRRVQVKSSLERLRRRLMKRHQLTEAQARERIPDSAARLTDLPFVVLPSASTGHRFRLFLALGAQDSAPREGGFNAYGLSSTATVPWF